MFSLAHLADFAIAVVSVTLFGIAFGQVYRPWQASTTGAVVRRVRLPFRARVRLHGVWLLGVTLLLLSASALGILVTPWPYLVAALAGAVLLACPVSYTITDHGIAVGRTAQRRWTEFGGLAARGGWIYLQPVAGARGVLIRTPGPACAGELTPELRRLVRDSYKGQIGPHRATVERALPADERLLPHRAFPAGAPARE